MQDYQLMLFSLVGEASSLKPGAEAPHEGGVQLGPEKAAVFEPYS